METKEQCPSLGNVFELNRRPTLNTLLHEEDLRMIKGEEKMLKAKLARQTKTINQLVAEKLERNLNLRDIYNWDDSVTFLSSLGETEEKLRKITEGLDKGKGSPLHVNLMFLLKLSEEAIFLQHNEKLSEIAKRNGLSKEYFPSEQLFNFEKCGTLFAKINGTCLKDILRNSPSPVSFFEFDMSAYKIKRYQDYDINLPEDTKDSSPAFVYPALTKHRICLAINISSALSALTPEFVEKTTTEILSQNPSEQEKELISKMQSIARTMHKLRKKSCDIIFSPNSPYFRDLRNSVLKYLENPNEEFGLMSLQALGINTSTIIVDKYRAARALSLTEGENSHFYKLLAKPMKEFISKLSQKINILTKDDLVPIIDADGGLDGNVAPTFADIFKIVNDVTQNVKEKEIHIDDERLEKISWSGLVQPQSIKVSFPQDGYQEFSLNLHYENEEGEILDIPLKFERERERLDWTLAESPDDPEVEKYKNAFFVATKSILILIQETMRSNIPKKQQEAEVKEQPIFVKPPKKEKR